MGKLTYVSRSSEQLARAGRAAIKRPRSVLNAVAAALLGAFTLSALTGPASAVIVVPRPDVACIIKTADPGTLDEGVSEDITYEVTVRSVGAGTADDVTITDTLPGDVTFVSAAAGCVHVAGTVTCDIGSLASGAQATRQIVVNAADPAPGDDLTNVASVSASNDASAGNNGGPGTSCEVTVGVKIIERKADMKCVLKTGDPETLDEGVSEDITYEVTVRNIGDGTANDVVITDELPDDVTFDSAAAGCVHVAGIVTCDIGSLAAGAQATRQIVVNASDPTPGDDLTNTASVSASNDTSASNNGGPGTSCEVDAVVKEKPRHHKKKWWWWWWHWY
jgi:uncharacterized repeat protein (TIGR01451 family)